MNNMSHRRAAERVRTRFLKLLRQGGSVRAAENAGWPAVPGRRHGSTIGRQMGGP